MKQSLQLKMGQSLTMTPQLQQAIRLLQLSTLDLQNEIQEALDSNPMLEVSEDTPTEETNDKNTIEQSTPESRHNNDSATEQSEESWNAENIPDDLPVDTHWDDVYQSPVSSSQSNDNEPIEFQRSSATTLHDHLMWQLNLTPFSDRDYHIALAIIDDIQPSGMLTTNIDELWQSLTLEQLEREEVLAVLHRIQQFDPPGVGSQNLGECLLIQLQQLHEPLDLQPQSLDIAKQIVQHHLNLLGAHDYKSLMRRLKVKEEVLKDAIGLIQATNPHPGEDIGSDHTEYIIPDVFVRKKSDRWVVELNPDIAPNLQINQQYAGMIKRADASRDNTFLKNNLQEARWFLKSLQSRNETLLKVATAIVEKQQGFLDFGEEAMKAMVLHDIATTVDMHESTISRVTTNKYMHTPKGIFELKYFFSSHVNTDAGGECSSTAIRAIIKKLIAAEDTSKPLSDSKIANLLIDQGIKVARRTIAKYRESMSIPPSNERKQLK